MSNIHSGGALQVAISFVSELVYLDIKNLSITLLVSSEINEQTFSLVFKNHIFYRVYNTFGILSIFDRIQIFSHNFDLVFTLFGPNYYLFKPKNNIVGFAQSLILFPSVVEQTSKSNVDFFLNRLKFFIQKQFFKRSDHLVVELSHVKENIVNKGIFNNKDITVVNNCISSIYFDKSLWQTVNINLSNDCLKIGYLTRGYPHKNIEILAHVTRILKEKYNFNVIFYFTLNDNEWCDFSCHFKGNGISVGEINVYQCPSFYQQMDAIIFPSLLESFSATPLEALFMEKPFFASDRAFVRDICYDYCTYFDPESADSIAEVIFEYFNSVFFKRYDLSLAKEHAIKFSSPKERAKSYINLIENYNGKYNV
jgi:glycosyltransferase involved in cell wall biosynthesis